MESSSPAHEIQEPATPQDEVLPLIFPTQRDSCGVPAAQPESPSALGVLDILAAETRVEIMHHCISNASIGLLLTNTRLYKESIPFLYEHFDLELLIDPTDHFSRVEILNQPGRFVNCLSYHRDTIFDAWPMDRFRSIKIVIRAPDPADPGQLIRCWRQATGLVSALGPRWRDAGKRPASEDDIVYGSGRSSLRLPPMSVDLQNTEARRWTCWTPPLPAKAGAWVWSHSVPSFHDWDKDGRWDWNWTGRPRNNVHVPDVNLADGLKFSDIEIIMGAFLRLRNLEALTVDFTDEPAIANGQAATLKQELLRQPSIRGLHTLSEVSEPFGCYPFDPVKVGDDHIQCREDSMHLWLDYLLDDLEGPTASILRRQRHQMWCCEYEYLMTDRLNGTDLNGIKHPWSNMYKPRFGGAVEFLPPSLLATCQKAFCDRFWAANRCSREVGLDQGFTGLKARGRDEVVLMASKYPEVDIRYWRAWDRSLGDGLPRRSDPSNVLSWGSWNDASSHKNLAFVFVPSQRGGMTNGELNGHVRWQKCARCKSPDPAIVEGEEGRLWPRSNRLR